MANHFIRIQPGTEYIEFGEIPKLTSEALYPNLPDDGEGDDPTRQDMLRGVARIEHERALERAEQMGTIKPRNPISLVPDSFCLGEHGQKRLVRIEEVQAFAYLLGILLVMASNKSESPTGIEYGPTMTIDDIGAALALQYGIPADAIVPSLIEAARDIGVRDPRTGLKVNAKTVRAHDLLAVPDVNAWLESQGVVYRLVLSGDDESVDIKPSGIKRAALIKKYHRQWPSVQSDLNEGSRNASKTASALNGVSLRVAAALGGGFYDEEKAVAWAKARGKFKESVSGITTSTLQGRVHRCE